MYNNFLGKKDSEFTQVDLTNAVLYKVPEQFKAAMKMTPRGIQCLDWLLKINNDRTTRKKNPWKLKYRLGVTILDSKIQGNLDAHGETKQPEKLAGLKYNRGIMILISKIKSQNGERMDSFSDTEVLNIVGIHERYHIKAAKKEYQVGDHFNLESLHYSDHAKQIAYELMSRLEYSLLYQDVDGVSVAPLSTWEENYAKYFTVSRDIKSGKTEKFGEYKELEQALNYNTYDLLDEMEKNAEFQSDVSESEKDLTRGKEKMNKLFQKSISYLERRYEKFKELKGGELSAEAWESYQKIYKDRNKLRKKSYNEILK